jgi:hypothetical protein
LSSTDPLKETRKAALQLPKQQKKKKKNIPGRYPSIEKKGVRLSGMTSQ